MSRSCGVRFRFLYSKICVIAGAAPKAKDEMHASIGPVSTWRTRHHHHHHHPHLRVSFHQGCSSSEPQRRNSASDVDQLQLRRATAPPPGHPDPIPTTRGPSSKRLSARPRQLVAPEASKLRTVSPSVTANKQRLRAFIARARVARPSRCLPTSNCASLIRLSRATQHSPAFQDQGPPTTCLKHGHH